MIISESSKISVKVLIAFFSAFIPAAIAFNGFIDSKIEEKTIAIKEDINKLDDKLEKIYSMLVMINGKRR